MAKSDVLQELYDDYATRTVVYTVDPRILIRKGDGHVEMPYYFALYVLDLGFCS